MKLFFTILLLPVLAFGQTAQLNFTYKNGATVGRWKVLDLPTTMFGPGTRQGQLLIYYPAGKDSAHVGLGIWQPGKGETSSLDVTQVYTSTTGGSLPAMIQKGLNPYSVLPNKDTIWHALVCIHNDFQSSYRAYLSTIVPYIMDKIGLKFNPNYTWASGLSEGGAGTWGIFCIDSLLSRRVHVNVAMATGGYDNFLTDQKLIANFKVACRNGVYFMPYVGTQDPGYNPGGFLATDAFLKTNALPGHYFPRVITNGTHSANVWDVPWKSRGFWDSLGIFGYSLTPAPPKGPPVYAKILQDSTEIHYPNTSIYLYDSSYAGSGVLSNSYFYVDSLPSGSIVKSARGAMSKGFWLFNLTAGTYRLRGYAFDSATNYVDTVYARFTVYGPPAPHKVTSIQVPWFGTLITIPVEAATLRYDDGNP